MVSERATPLQSKTRESSTMSYSTLLYSIPEHKAPTQCKVSCGSAQFDFLNGLEWSKEKKKLIHIHIFGRVIVNKGDKN